MPDTAAKLQPLSRTEIAMRIKGIIADVFCCGCDQVKDESRLKYVGVSAHESIRSSTAVVIAALRIEESFGVRFDLLRDRPVAFTHQVTVGELIAQVEGALSQRGMA